jgi:hypothetical protein
MAQLPSRLTQPPTVAPAPVCDTQGVAARARLHQKNVHSICVLAIAGSRQERLPVEKTDLRNEFGMVK